MTLTHAAAVRAGAQFADAMSQLVEEALRENTAQIEARLEQAGFLQPAVAVPATFLAAEQTAPPADGTAAARLTEVVERVAEDLAAAYHFASVQRGHTGTTTEVHIHGAVPPTKEQTRAIARNAGFTS